jgi:DNA mismatch repair protein MutS2
VAVGDRVVLKNLGGEGQVVAISGDHAQVRTGAVTVRIALDQLAPAGRAAPAAPARPKRAPPPPPASLDRAVRLPSNTLDLRGQRVDEGLDAADRFLDRALRGGHDVVFLLHGHGTGAMKQALRQWLPTHPTVRSWAPAAEDQGGDAFTVAHLDPG